MLQKYKVIVKECGKDGWVPVHPISDTTFPGLNEAMMFLAKQIDFYFMSVKGYLIGDSNSVFGLECVDRRNEDNIRFLRIEVWKTN